MAFSRSTLILSACLLLHCFTTTNAAMDNYVSWGSDEGIRIVDMVWDGQLFFAIGSPNCVPDKKNHNKCKPIGWSRTAIVSSDGLTWKEVPLAESSERLISMSFGSGKYVVLATTWDKGNKCHIILSEDGKAWQRYYPKEMHEGETYERIRFVSGHFIAFGRNGNAIASKEGRDWFKIETGTSDRLIGIVPDADNILVASENAMLLCGSINGKFEVSALPEKRVGKEKGKYRVEDIARSDSLIVAVGTTGYSSVFLTSSDGKEWHIKEFQGFNRLFRAVVYAKGLFVAVGEDIAFSQNGKEWFFVNESKRGLDCVTANDDIFVVTPSSNPQNTISFYTSDNATNWTGGTVARGGSSEFNIPPIPLETRIVGEKEELAKEERDHRLASFMINSAMSGTSFILFVVLQVYVFFKLRGISWKCLAAIPTVLCSVVLLQALFAYKDKANLWPLGLIFYMPLLIIFLVFILIIYLSRNLFSEKKTGNAR